jgi:hypothetical protein
MPRGKHLKPEAGAKTRFGQPGGADPKKATKAGCPKWSIRKSVQYLANKTVAELKEIRAQEPTVAQLIALVALQKASNCDMQAVNYATENIDGKLPQETQLTGKDGDALQAPVIYLPDNGRSA